MPGLLKEKVIQLVKTLPQKIRSKLVPVPEFAAEFVVAVPPSGKSLVSSLIDYILQHGLNARGWEITPDAFRPDVLLPADEYSLIDRPRPPARHEPQPAQLRADWGREAKQEFAELHETPSEYAQADRLDLWRTARTDGG